MQTLTEIMLSKKDEIGSSFSDIDVANLLFNRSAASRYALLKRALAAREIIRVRRGLYVLASRYRTDPIDLYSLASQIYKPSYISQESALSIHGIIPEEVKTVTSASFKRSCFFDTPLGQFRYHKSIFRDLFSVEHVKVDRFQSYLLASPLRALAELVSDPKLRLLSLVDCIESLRIEPEEIKSVVTKQNIEETLRQPLPKKVRVIFHEMKQELFS